MYVVQKRDSEKAQWHTCSYNGKKCRFSDIAKARTAFRKQKGTSDAKKHPDRQYRIYDTLSNSEAQ
ncbi:MAG: hypothetical protein J6I68_11600 [Butyrivibrio sp.]|uniref:hypothetical protein n=1 Tax=Butyrivibrio sp. TaxID=28121 RepID=UPI001B72FB7D|nr:hypothetical protein [Butyrivibrio sp.]MBP3783881.1 hypothetical protein [Butyrivibrio sp.]